MSNEQRKGGPQKVEAPPARPQPKTPLFSKDDLPHIRKALSVFVVVAVLAGAFVLGSGELAKEEIAMQQVMEAQRDEARRQYQMTQTELEEIREYQPKFLALQEKRFFGAERRLELAERIHAVQKDRKLFAVNYELAPQQVFQVDAAVATQGLELRGSRLSLRSQLLHEADLFHLLHDLSSNQMLVPQRCNLLRSPSSAAALAPRINAECTFYWVTLGGSADAVAGEAK